MTDVLNTPYFKSSRIWHIGSHTHPYTYHPFDHNKLDGSYRLHIDWCSNYSAHRISIIIIGRIPISSIRWNPNEHQLYILGRSNKTTTTTQKCIKSTYTHNPTNLKRDKRIERMKKIKTHTTTQNWKENKIIWESKNMMQIHNAIYFQCTHTHIRARLCIPDH